MTAEEYERGRVAVGLVLKIASYLLTTSEVEAAEEYLRVLAIEAQRSRNLDALVAEHRKQVGPS